MSPDSHTRGAGRSGSDTTDGRSNAAAGARVYRVLGEQFLQRPDGDRVDAVGTWAGEWRRTTESLPLEFESALERIESGADADEETLRQAYTHLFRGISDGVPAPPYESMYVDGQFYSGTTTEIRRGYRWAGVDVDTSRGNEPPDHLGLELQFLGELVAMDRDGTVPAEDPDEPDVGDAQWWILDEHLTEWLPAYHARLGREEPAEYYAGILDLTLAAVKARHGTLTGER